MACLAVADRTEIAFFIQFRDAVTAIRKGAVLQTLCARVIAVAVSCVTLLRRSVGSAVTASSKFDPSAADIAIRTRLTVPDPGIALLTETGLHRPVGAKPRDALTFCVAVGSGPAVAGTEIALFLRISFCITAIRQNSLTGCGALDAGLTIEWAAIAEFTKLDSAVTTISRSVGKQRC